MFSTQRLQSRRILAVGSPHGDDQAAWHVADVLLEEPSFQGKCAKLSTPWELLAHLSTPSGCVVVDACQSGAAPGTIHQLTPGEIPEFANSTTSSHGGTLSAAFRLAEVLGYDLAGISIYAIEAGACEPGTPLSETVRCAADELATHLRCLLADGFPQD
jgi:hydrogenase maturation protease